MWNEYLAYTCIRITSLLCVLLCVDIVYHLCLTSVESCMNTFNMCNVSISIFCEAGIYYAGCIDWKAQSISLVSMFMICV